MAEGGNITDLVGRVLGHLEITQSTGLGIFFFSTFFITQGLSPFSVSTRL